MASELRRNATLVLALFSGVPFAAMRHRRALKLEAKAQGSDGPAVAQMRKQMWGAAGLIVLLTGFVVLEVVWG